MPQIIKITLLIMSAVLISTCYGINGQPLELVGTWECNTVNDDGTDKTEIDHTLTITDNGYFTWELEFDNGSMTTYEGNVIGDVTITPKIITFIVEDTTIEYASGRKASRDTKTTWTYDYYLSYSNFKTKLAMDGFTFVKQ